jgi:hypothetical protein
MKDKGGRVMTYYEDMDYNQAEETINDLFKSCCVVADLGRPFGEVRDNNWPCVSFNIEFTNDRGASFKTKYSMGIGLFNLKKNRRAKALLNMDQRKMFDNLIENPSANYVDKQLIAETVASVARITKQRPNPATVLASCCEDGLRAYDTRFEEWAFDFGYDPDSRKAEKIYDTCRHQYFECLDLIGRENVERMSELARML